MIRFALVVASVLGFVLTAALGNMMVPLLRELQRAARGTQPDSDAPDSPVPTMGGLCLMVGTLAAVGVGWLAACAAQPSLLGSDRQMTSRLLIALLGSLAFGAVGLADDLARIRGRYPNGLGLGLRRTQRLALECIAAVLVLGLLALNGCLPTGLILPGAGYVECALAPLLWAVLLVAMAEAARVAAGGALAVDRDAFSAEVTRLVEACPNITVHRERVERIDESAPILVATGPLTDGALADEIGKLTGDERLHFYDAVAPIVTAESLDHEKVFAASRYDRGEADYLNCPFNKAEYEAFHAALASAERAPLHDFDTGAEQSARPDPDAHGKKADTVTVYEGCMPIEIMAARGADTMRFGPLRPVGLVDPRTGHRPWANVQLRAENKDRTLYNIVGFQTNLKWGEQKRVFRMIPGLEHAEFVRYGVMHRNTFLDAPRVLEGSLCLKEHPNVFFAGQITGFEGYMESAASGLLAARNLYARLEGKVLPPPPVDTMCGALIQYLTTENKHFQPMGANMGILPPLPEESRPRDKRLRYMAQAQRAVASFQHWLDETSL